MYARIIPALRLPRRLGIFDYSVPEGMTVKPGALVMVQFRGKRTPAVVHELLEQTEVKGKAVKPIISSLDVVLPEDLRYLISWITDNTLVSPALAAKTILPEIPKRAKDSSAPRTPQPGAELRISRNAATHIREVVAKLVTEQSDIRLLRYRDPAEKIVALTEFCRERDRGGILILVPRQQDLAAVEAVLRPRIPEVAILESTLRPDFLWKEWRRIRSGTAPVVVGTRMAVFAPFPELRRVIICDEESPEYKAEDNPHLDARVVATIRAQQTKASLTIISQAPRMESFQMSQKFGAPIELSEPKPRDIEILDLAQEVRERGTVFCDRALLAMENALADGKTVAIFQNRRGAGGSLQCRDCSYVFECPECNLPWTVHAQILKCHHCNRTAPIPLSCPACGGTRLKSAGGGTQRIESELRTQFPQARILRLDSDAPAVTASEFREAQIVIGTRLLVGRFREIFKNLRPVGVVGIPLAELVMSRGSFRASEYAHQWFTSVINIGLYFGARILIQTRNPENHVLQSVANGGYDFYNTELESRRTFNYPPFSRLTLLVYRAQMEAAAEREAERTAVTLRAALGKDVKSEVIGPFVPTPGKRGGAHLRAILVKSPAGVPPPQEVRSLPPEWIIDVDTENV